MNEKLAKAKKKIKKHIPEITLFAIGITAAAIATVGVMKQVKTASIDGIEPFAALDDETKEKLMKESGIVVFKLSENEYLFNLPSEFKV